MRIQHNISALNASNELKINNNAISKNIAKLSSGYRINSAADDAAGLAVSEKMRSQINGLTQAQDNTENGISLIQTAEGGLNETSAILQRMNTLAVESANGTYQNGTDRTNLQKEVTALKSEVDRISTSTNFNQINLLDGSLDSTGSVVVDATVATNVTTTAAAPSSSQFAIVKGSETGTNDTFTFTVNNGTSVETHSVNVTGQDTNDVTKTGNALVTALGSEGWAKNYDIVNSSGTLTFTAKVASAAAPQVTNVKEDVDNASAGGITTPAVTMTDYKPEEKSLSTSGMTATGTSAADDTSKVFTVGGRKFAYASGSTDVGKVSANVGKDVDVIDVSTNNTGALIAAEINKVVGEDAVHASTTATKDIAFGSGKAGDSSLSFQVGADNKEDQRVSLSIGNMSSNGLGISGVDVSTQPAARAAIDTVKAAINKVNSTRADLGALQNELEHTANNLSVMTENLTSAEANIRDVDMSAEYVQYSKNQILSQAANAMLAQANAQPQSVLTLIKS